MKKPTTKDKEAVKKSPLSKPKQKVADRPSSEGDAAIGLEKLTHADTGITPDSLSKHTFPETLRGA